MGVGVWVGGEGSWVGRDLEHDYEEESDGLWRDYIDMCKKLFHSPFRTFVYVRGFPGIGGYVVSIRPCPQNTFLV